MAPFYINGSTGISGVDGSAATPALQGTDTNTGISFGSDVIIASTGGSERLRIDPSGRVGIGKTPDATAFPVVGGLQLAGGANLFSWGSFGGTYLTANAFYNGSNWIYQANNASSVYIAADGNHVWLRASSGTAGNTAALLESARIDSSGNLLVGYTSGSFHRIGRTGGAVGSTLLSIEAGGGDHFFQQVDFLGYNTPNSGLKLGRNNSTSRSLNAGGTINASGADYAEYMTKAGNFDIAKGDVCGVTSDGKLTNTFVDAVGFLVKSTNPSYVGGDTWGTEEVVGAKPSEDEVELLAEWEAALEAERQKVDRIAFAGQVPVNVTGATPGQYIVPIATEDGGITGIAKDEVDLTLAEYVRAVGKVIATEDDGRARIIVKVA